MLGQSDFERISNEVMRDIAARRLFRLQATAVASGAVGVAGVFALIPAVSYTLTLSDASGFMSYVSLVVSDGATVAGSWKMLLMSVAESAPIAGGVFILAAVIVFLYSFKRLVNDMATIKTYRHATI